MTMAFDVVNTSLLTGLESGQAVDVVIERIADGRHRITEIVPTTDMPAEPNIAEPESSPEMEHIIHEAKEMNQ